VGLSRARAIDHLLYESNSGFWRWVTGGRGNPVSIAVQSPLSGPRPTIAPAVPHRRGYGSPYRVRFGPFLLPRYGWCCSSSGCRACRSDGGSPGILKVDLTQRKRHSDGGDNDDKGRKPPVSGPTCFFALRVTRPLQIGHRDALPFAFNRDF
jgi:hypothetical protein